VDEVISFGASQGLMLSKLDRKGTVHGCAENAHVHDPGSWDGGGHRSLAPVFALDPAYLQIVRVTLPMLHSRAMKHAHYARDEATASVSAASTIR
jgi:hypothetical protein